MSEQINEGRHQVKRVYGEHKRIRINEKGAPVRDTIIKYVGKNYVREQDLHNFLIRLEEDRDGNTKINKARWFKRNQKFFTTLEKNDEKYISLSKYGQRVLELLNSEKEIPKEINESTHRNIPSLEEHMVSESHDLTYQPEMENARMMQSSVAEFTKFLQRKVEESKPENFREVIIDINNINEADWTEDVKTKWHPPAGLFTTSADNIAKTLKGASKDLEQAMARLNFYINRAGKNLDAKTRKILDDAKKVLDKLYKK